MTVFGLYARYYDLLYQDKDYAAEVDYVSRCVQRHCAAPKRILELGCGTGSHAFLLAERGFDVTGLDVSAGMIARAQERQQMIGTDRVTFKTGDARSHRENSLFDVVLSLFHVMSYQVSNADLLDAFRTAAAHMHQQSVFAFDFWYGPAVLTQRPETRVKRLQDGESKVLRIAESTLDENQNFVDVTFTVQVEDLHSADRQQIVETHRMRYLFLPEIDFLLAAAGLERVDARAWMSDAPLSKDAWGGFVIARMARGERRNAGSHAG
jgi:SAM-dependent methyltransferase